MESFSPLGAMVGGTLIGLAAAVLWLGNGQIAGISGIFRQVLPPVGMALWRLLFLVSLVLATWATSHVVPGLAIDGAARKAAKLVDAPAGWGISTPIWIAMAGLLVGLGTRIGNGCTSGHGVCGLARLSPRSLVAVTVFFGVAILTVAVTGIV